VALAQAPDVRLSKDVCVADAAKKFPVFPDIPAPECGTEGNGGNVGKDGNVYGDTPSQTLNGGSKNSSESAWKGRL
jgi:hypothetical protein